MTMAIKNLKLKFIEATPNIHDMWESRIFKEYAKMVGFDFRLTRIKFGAKKSWILSSFAKSDARFVHFSGHVKKDALIFGDWMKEISVEEIRELAPPGGLKNRILTLSACEIGADQDNINKIAETLNFQYCLAPVDPIAFKDSAFFYFHFYSYIGAYLRENDNAETRSGVIEEAYHDAVSGTMSVIGGSSTKQRIRLYKTV